MKIKKIVVKLNEKTNLYEVIGTLKIKIILKQGEQVLGLQKKKKKIVLYQNKDFLVCSMFKYIIQEKYEHSKILGRRCK